MYRMSNIGNEDYEILASPWKLSNNQSWVQIKSKLLVRKVVLSRKPLPK